MSDKTLQEIAADPFQTGIEAGMLSYVLAYPLQQSHWEGTLQIYGHLSALERFAHAHYNDTQLRQGLAEGKTLLKIK